MNQTRTEICAIEHEPREDRAQEEEEDHARDRPTRSNEREHDRSCDSNGEVEQDDRQTHLREPEHEGRTDGDHDEQDVARDRTAGQGTIDARSLLHRTTRILRRRIVLGGVLTLAP